MLGFPICEGGTVVTIQGPRFSGTDVCHNTLTPQVFKQSREPHVQVVGSRRCEHDKHTRGATGV